MNAMMKCYCLIMATIASEYASEECVASPPPPPLDAFDYTRFESTMTLVAHIRVGGHSQTNGTLYIVADEVTHGVSDDALDTPFGPYLGRHLFYAMVYGDSSDAVMHLLFEDGARRRWTLNGTLIFRANSAIGSATSPIELVSS
jgi:hypothetical protein